MSDGPSLIGLDAPTVDWSRLRGMTGVAKPEPIPTFMETARASYELAQADRVGDDEQAVIDAYGPIVTQLSERGRAATRYVTAARGVGRPINEDAVWADIAAARAADKGAFPDLPATRDQFRSQVLAKYRQDLARAQDVTGRGSTVATLAGGFVAGFTDPVNLGTMFIGGGGSTVARRIASEALANAGVELVQQPLVAAQREKTGRDLSVGEAVANVAVAGAVGGAFAGAAIGAKKLVERARTPGGELARQMRERIGWGRMTDAEQAAVRTLEREDEILASSPFRPGADTERYAAQVNAIVEAVTAPDVSPSRLDQLVPLQPAPRQRPVSVSDAAARLAVDPWEQFKGQVRRAESGGNDQARNPRSTATGRYQVIDDTWLRVARTLPGSEHMTDAGLLGMRTHPVWQEKVMDALGREYRAALSRVGAQETPGNLYLMHFAGTGGGAKILRAAGDTPIEEILSAKAISSNPFLRGKSADDVIDWAHQAMNVERGNAPVLRRDIFPEDDGGDAAWREAQREVEAADRDWVDWTREEGPPRAADEWGDDDIPFDLDDPRGIVRQGVDPFEDPPAALEEQVPLYANVTGRLPRKGVAPAFLGNDDRVYVGSAMGTHFTAAKPALREIGIKDTGFADAEGRFLTRSEALQFVNSNGEKIRPNENMPGELDAMDYREQSAFAALPPQDEFAPRVRQTADEPVEDAPADSLVPSEDMNRYWADAAASGRKLEPLFAVRSAEGGDLVWWTPSRQQAQRLLREEPGRYSMERIDAPDQILPSTQAAMLEAFDDPDGAGVSRQIDSLEHDLRMFLEAEEAAGMTVRLDEEGDVISAADLMSELDEDEAAIAAARACMVPPAKAA